MKEREAKIPPQFKRLLREALERLVKFYESKGDPAGAERWRKELGAGSGPAR